MTVLVLAQHDNQNLHPATCCAIQAASQLGDVVVLVAGFDAEAVAQQASICEKVAKVLYVDNKVYEYPVAEVFAQILKQVQDDGLGVQDDGLGVQDHGSYTHIIAAATTFGKNVMPRLAGQLGLTQVSDVIEILDKQTYKRPMYAGNVIATVKNRDSLQIITVRPTAFEAVSDGANVPIEKADVIVDNAPSEYVGLEQHNADRPQLDQADIVISGGRGLKDENGFAALMQIADRMGAAFGASRAAVDAGLAPNDCQVGQTGKVVAPKLYFAVGISGAIQHIAGMKDSKTIVAINKDPDAPIFQIADYGLVADIEKVLPEWNKKLDEMGL